MPHADRFLPLRHLALLYLNMAHRADDYLTDAELASVTEKLHAHDPSLEWARVQDIVMESLALYTKSDDAEALATQSVRALREVLSPRQKSAVLDDLRHVAGADGVVLDEERGLLASLERHWEVEHRQEQAPSTEPAADEAAHWGVLHDLAYIYLHLAHATDNELSPQEMQVMLNKLREWQPGYSEEEAQQVMNAAMDCYARGSDEARLERAIGSVRDDLPRAQRMAALNDLIKIANADGVFLDLEEDMINNLLAAWDVDPYANYGEHGTKDS